MMALSVWAAHTLSTCAILRMYPILKCGFIITLAFQFREASTPKSKKPFGISLRDYQDAADFTRMLAVSEEMKTFPFGDVWNEYCERQGAPVGMEWLREVEVYEAEVLSKR